MVAAGWGPELRSEPVATELAQRNGRTSARVLLRWHVELGLVPEPKSEDPRRLRENIAVFDLTLTPDDVVRLSAPDRGNELLLDPENLRAPRWAYGSTTPSSSRIVTVPLGEPWVESSADSRSFRAPRAGMTCWVAKLRLAASVADGPEHPEGRRP